MNQIISELDNYWYLGMLGQLEDMLDLLKRLPSINTSSSLQQVNYIAFEQNLQLHPYMIQKLRNMGFQLDVSTDYHYVKRIIVNEEEVAVNFLALDQDITSNYGIEALHRITDRLQTSVDLIIGQ